MSRNRTLSLAGLADTFSNIRNDYAAARESRFRRRRDGIVQSGSSADYHFRNELDYFKVIEYARDFDRNDAVVGQMVDRAVLNTVQGGFTCDPDTGDEDVNAELYDLFHGWASDPQQCDSAGEMTFADQQEMVLRSAFVDGDDFALPREDGTLELAEAHRCRSQFIDRTGLLGKFFGQTRIAPMDSNVVIGVQMDERRRRTAYWFTEDEIDPLSISTASNVEAKPYAAFDDDGEPLVFHVFNPKRITQTRGVTAFAPVFDTLGMFEDTSYAKLVQQQVVSCITFISEKDANFTGTSGLGPMGSRRQEERSDGETGTIDEMQPGKILDGRKGEKFVGFSPNVPNAEWFPHARMILQLIGVNLGMPLVMLLMDASDTNFSGWRGAVDQARMGFRRNQRWLRDKFHNRVYRWKVRQFLAESELLRSAEKRLGSAIYRVKWTAPNWKYIQPLQDAQADKLREEAGLTSPRRLHAESGQDVDDVRDETMADNDRAIRKAIEYRNQLETDTGVRVDPSRFLWLNPSMPLETATAEPEETDEP